MEHEKLLKELQKKIDFIETRLSTLETAVGNKGTTTGKKISIKEFLLSRKPSDDAQKTLAIGYYLEHYESMESFNAQDLLAGFRAAKEPSPSNVNDRVNSNIRKAYMMDVKEPKDNRKAWELTNSGEKFVESNFEGD